MTYLGDEKYEIFLGTRFIVLTQEEIKYFFDEINNSFYEELLDTDDDTDDNEGDKSNQREKNIYRPRNNDTKPKVERKKRSYNKHQAILKLFNQYYCEEKTKKSVFKKISDELQISIKAIEKAYYKK